MPDLIKHLYNRAGFGLSPAEWKKRQSKSPAKELERLIRESKTFEPLKVVGGPAASPANMSKEDRKAFRQAQRQLIGDLNQSWMHRMGSGKGALRERMTLFWHGHFACRIKSVYASQQLNHVLRAHAFGNFRDMLLAVSRSPAMLQFLNNQQNRKAHPNENFAREVMELFTLGQGKYTENDIKEAARAFTGWGFNKEGDFVFRKRQHDEGQKTFLGLKGNLGGEDIIDRILKEKDCARFLCRKMYRYFVSPQVNEEAVEALALKFYDSNYELLPLIRELFNSEAFLAESSIGARIKSPVDLITGLMRQLDLGFENKRPLLALEKVLGQVLFQPPNVAGWPGNTYWIDSSRMMARMSLPSFLLDDAEFRYEASGDDDTGAPGFKGFKGKNTGGEVNWGELQKVFGGENAIKTRQTLASYFLAPGLEMVNLDPVQIPAGGDVLKSLILQVMTLPEYQLC